MNALELAGEIILLSASGVLSPGPLFLVNLILGSKQGFHAGIKVALGHCIVELPLMIILTLALLRFSPVSIISNGSLGVIGLLGGISIIVFSFILMSSLMKRKVTAIPRHDNNNDKRSLLHVGAISSEIARPIILGVVFTAFNPFFIAWWLTVGLKLISDSVSTFGVANGILFLFFLHIWMDCVWLIFTSYLISKGVSILNGRYYNFFLVGLSSTLTFYGLYIIILHIFRLS